MLHSRIEEDFNYKNQLTKEEMTELLSTTDKILNPNKVPNPIPEKKNPRFIIEKVNNGYIVIVINGIYKKMIAVNIQDVLEIIKNS